MGESEEEIEELTKKVYEGREQVLALNKELKELKKEEKELEKKEEKHIRIFSEIELQESLYEEECKSIEKQTWSLSQKFDVASKERVWEKLFDIGSVLLSQKRHIGTINGLRLGFTEQTEDIHWEEFNEAMGQVSLLVRLLAFKLGWKFKKFVPLSCGPLSSMAEINSGKLTMDKNLKLFSSSFSALSFHNALNSGISALLACISEINDQLKKKLKVPIPYT